MRELYEWIAAGFFVLIVSAIIFVWLAFTTLQINTIEKLIDLLKQL